MMPKFPSSRNMQSGLTLVELMVAMTIGIFLLGAVAALYVNTRGGFDYSNELARMQENGRFALDMISRDLRMAGFNGCGGDVIRTTNLVNGSAGNALLDFSTPVRGYEGGTSTFPSSLTTAGALITSDAIVIMNSQNDGNDLVVQSHVPTSATIHTGTHSLKPGAIVMITDCSMASIFQVTGPTNNNNNAELITHNKGNSDPGPGNCEKELGASCPNTNKVVKEYKPGSLITQMSSTAYFIGNSSQNDGTRSLFSMELTGTTGGTPTPRELLNGIDDMQIAYGIDTDKDGDVDSYVTANAVGNWSQVSTIRVSLLVRSTRTNLAVGNQPYIYMTTSGSIAESTVTGSRTLRRVFTETVTLRNRVK